MNWWWDNKLDDSQDLMRRGAFIGKEYVFEPEYLKPKAEVDSVWCTTFGQEDCHQGIGGLPLEGYSSGSWLFS